MNHIADHDLERYYLGMIRNEAELAPFEEHLLACAGCAERAEEAADYVDAMRGGSILGDFDLEISAISVENFRIRSTGKEHSVGNINCPGCGVVNGIRYPHPHHEHGSIIHLEFLVHGEGFYSTFDQYCEGGCPLPPIELAPKPLKELPANADLLCQLDLVKDGLRLGTDTIRKLKHHQKVDVGAVLRRLVLVQAETTAILERGCRPQWSR